MKNYNSILFINYGGIGDEILFLPAIQSIKEAYPKAKITLALEPRSKCIKELSSNIDETISVDIKAKGAKKYLNVAKFIISLWFRKFDCVISSGKSPLVAIILFLSFIKEKVGYESKTDFLLSKKVPLNENQYAAKMYHDLVKPICNSDYKNPSINVSNEFKLNPDLSKNNYIAIHPGVSLMSLSKNIKKCPEVNFWLNLIKGLLHKNKQIVLLGTNDDKDLIEKIIQDNKINKNPNFFNYFKKTKNIMEMAFIMQNANCTICVDSAPLHVSVAVGAKTYAIFAPTNERKLAPDCADIEIITNNIPCRPCLWHKRAFNCEKSECLNIDYNLILDKIN